MKTIAIYLVKKYAIKAVKDAVNAKSDEVSKYAMLVSAWIVRVKMCLAFLETLSGRLSDGVLTDEEIDLTMEDAQILANEVTK